MKYIFMQPTINGSTEFDVEYVDDQLLLDDYCLITEIHNNQTGRIIRPDTATVVPHSGFVHSVGPKVSVVKPNTVVTFSKYSGFEAEFGRHKYLFIREKDIVSMTRTDTEQMTSGNSPAGG